MTIFDLLFILAFLSAVVALAIAAYQAIRGRFSRAGSVLTRVALSAAVYLATISLVSIFSPRRVLKPGDERCFDDWCFQVADVSRTPSAERVSYRIGIRLFSRAKGRAQRANDVVVYLVDGLGDRFEPEPDQSAVPFNILLQPGESVTATRVFSIPAGARDVGLVLEHGGSGPGLFIIGDDLSLLHKRTVVRLD
jgi:hypothetical protein